MSACTQHSIPAVLQIISTIPPGRVATYGQIARLAGLPGHARQVGQILKQLPGDSRLPWHRVINARGHSSLSGHAREQQFLRLTREGVDIDGARINLRRYQWRP